MTKNELKDLIKVIKEMKKLGVKHLKMGTLEFEIATEQENIEKLRADRPAFKPSKKTVEEANKKNALQLEMNTAQDDLSTMHVEDPLAFEQAIVEQAVDDIEESRGDIFEETQYQ